MPHESVQRIGHIAVPKDAHTTLCSRFLRKIGQDCWYASVRLGSVQAVCELKGSHVHLESSASHWESNVTGLLCCIGCRHFPACGWRLGIHGAGARWRLKDRQAELNLNLLEWMALSHLLQNESFNLSIGWLQAVFVVSWWVYTVQIDVTQCCPWVLESGWPAIFFQSNVQSIRRLTLRVCNVELAIL